MKRKDKIAIIIFIIIILAVAWYLKPYKPVDEVEYIFNNNTEVNIDDRNWLIFKPVDTKTNTGFIFYPGARVEPKAYAPLAHEIAKSGYIW